MKVVILGAGVAGLAAAMELLEKGVKDVTILEKHDYVGGLAASNKIEWEGTRLIPKNYHHILEDDIYTFENLKKIGIYEKLYWKKINFAFRIKNRFIKISTLKGFLEFPAPLREKIKFGLLVLRTTLRKNWEEWGKYNTKEFVEKEVGPVMYEKLIKPLQTFKFGEEPDAMSAAWFANRLGGEAKNFLKKFGYIDGGLYLMIHGMERKVKEGGGKIILGVDIKKAEILSKEVKSLIYESNGKTNKIECDYVISSLPSRLSIEIFGLKDTNLKKVKYRGSICIAFGLNRIFTPYYWSMILDKGFPFGAFFTHSNLYPKAAPKGKSVVFAVNFYDQDDPVWKKSEDMILKEFKDGMERLFPGFKSSIEWLRVQKELYSEPLYEKNYYKYRPRMISEIPNLILCGTAFIFPRIRNMSASIESGISAARLVIGEPKE